MSKIKVDTVGISSMEQMLRRQESEMRSIENTLNQILNDLDMEIAVAEGIKDEIISLRKRTEDQREHLNDMANVLAKTNDDFIHTDKELANQSKKVANIEGLHTGFINLKPSEIGLLDILDNGLINVIFGITHEGYTAMQEALEAIHNFLDVQENGIAEMSEEWKELYDYLRNNDPTFLFGQYAYAAHFINDLKWYDAYIYSLVNWKEAFMSIISGGSVDQMAQRFLDNPDECKAVLRNVIDTICQTEYLDLVSPDGEKFLDIMQDAAGVAGFEDAETFMKEVRSLFGDVETADKILKDYSDNIAMLQSLKETLNGGSVLDDTIDNLISEYQDQVTSMIFDDIKSKIEEGVVNIVDYATGLKFGAVDTVIQATFGKLPEMDSINTVLFTTDMRGEAIHSFQEAAKVIQSGNFTAEDVTTYKNTFNLAKALTIEQYEAMENYYISGSKEAEFLREQIRALESMDYTKFNYAESFNN